MAWVVLSLAVLILPLQWLLAAVMAGVVHELGHYLALKVCGVTVYGFRFGYSGARMSVGRMNPWQSALCALAGPLAGLSLLLAAKWFPRTAVCACVQSAYNLLPVYPLDGGHILRSLGLSRRGCVIVERLALGGILFAGIYGCGGLHLGIFPILLAIFTVLRALAGKGLAKRHGFRYNRERLIERGTLYDGSASQNSSHGAKTCPVHRWRIQRN